MSSDKKLLNKDSNSENPNIANEKSSPDCDNKNLNQDNSSQLSSPDDPIILESNCATPMRKKGWQRGRKRKCLPRDAPKGPLSGYLLYMSEQRVNIRKEMTVANKGTPPPSFAEVTKEVAVKWAALPSEEKQKYLDKSEAQKERYQKEMEAYQKTEAYKNFLENKQSNGTDTTHLDNSTEQISTPQNVKKENCIPKISPPVNGVNNNNSIEDFDKINAIMENPFEIPIFTEQFLKHNQEREVELKKLRKSNTDYEEQNALLEKQIENINFNIEKHKRESELTQQKNEALEKHLTTLREKLSAAFQNTPAPGWTSPPTFENIDEYLSSLHAALTASPPAHNQSRATQQSVQQIVTNLILQ